MQHSFDLSPKQARMLRAALRRHDGQSLHPELGDCGAWQALTTALDKLRLILMGIENEVKS